MANGMLGLTHPPPPPVESNGSKGDALGGSSEGSAL